MVRPIPLIRRRVWWLGATCALTLAGAACGGGEGGEGVDGPVGPVARGERLAGDRGCRSCHQARGGGIGPGWDGLYGSTVELDDGTTVVADDAYLTRAITDPDAQRVDGYATVMPSFDDLSDAEVADLVAYIRSRGGS